MHRRSLLASSISVAILILLSAGGRQPSSASPASSARADRDGPRNFRTPRGDQRIVFINVLIDGYWHPPLIRPGDGVEADLTDWIVIDPDDMLIPTGPPPKQ